jgi:hypothetical protein
MYNTKKSKTGNRRLEPKTKKNNKIPRDEMSLNEQKRELLRIIQETEDVDTILEVSYHEDPQIRLKAV